MGGPLAADPDAAGSRAARAADHDSHGDDGTFPAPQVLRTLDLDLPGRKAEYLHAVATAALDGILDGVASSIDGRR